MAATPTEDPFDCFGGDGDSDSDDDGDGGRNGGAGEVKTKSQLRDPVCGVLTFHNGTEQSLCHYVQQAMEQEQTKKDADGVTRPPTTTSTSQRVLHHIDQFCYTRHWMMHVGDQKGLLLQNFVTDFCHYQSIPARLSSTVEKEKPITIVELGTYCGYSSILMAQTILQQQDNNNNPSSTANFHIYSVDVDRHHQAVAQELVKMAKLDQYITFILLEEDGDILVQALQKCLPPAKGNNINDIDFLFIDHDKDLYCSDLEQLEQNGMIQPGTHVAADNVVFFDIPYRSYIQTRKDQGIVSSRLVMGQLEYIIDQELQGLAPSGGGTGGTESAAPTEDAVRDGIELSVYLKDPRQIINK